MTQEKRFVEELVSRVRRAGAQGPLALRADSDFFSYALVDTLCRLKVCYSITARVQRFIDTIDESAWLTTALFPVSSKAMPYSTWTFNNRNTRRGHPDYVFIFEPEALGDDANRLVGRNTRPLAPPLL